MRVTFVLPLLPLEPVGGFKVVYTYANALVARGHSVTVVHGDRVQPLPLPRTPRQFVHRWRRRRARALLVREGITWFQMDPRVRLAYFTLPRARQFPDADVLVTTAWQTAERSAGLPARCGLPVSLLQADESWGGSNYTDRYLATWHLPWPKVVIASWLANLAQQRGVPDVTVIRNGLDHETYRLHQPLEGRPRQIAMMYGQQAVKGTAVGLQALEIALSRVPDASAVLFGTVSPPSSLPPRVRAVQLPSTAVLVEEIYNGSAVFLCSSNAEGWGLPSTEAMACGCALVTTANQGAQEFAENDLTALVRPVGDAEALADAIVQLLTDEPLRTRLAAAGRDRVAELDWERSTDAFESFLQLRINAAPAEALS